MKNVILIIFFQIFIFGCRNKDTVINPMTKQLKVTYDEARTTKSISLNDSLDDYLANFEITFFDGNTTKNIPVDKNMISLDTSSVGEKEAIVTYNGLKAIVPVVISTPINQFSVVYNTIFHYLGTDSFVVVPRYINGIEIAILGTESFSNNLNLERIIANNILFLSDGNDNEKKGAFEGCKNLKSISISKTIYLGKYTLYGCKSLNSIIFGNRPPALSEYSIMGCNDSIWNIVVPGGAKDLYMKEYSSYPFLDMEKPTYLEY